MSLLERPVMLILLLLMMTLAVLLLVLCVVCPAHQLEVLPDEEIRVVHAHEVNDDDYASVFDGVNAGELARQDRAVSPSQALHGCSDFVACVRNCAVQGAPFKAAALIRMLLRDTSAWVYGLGCLALSTTGYIS